MTRRPAHILGFSCILCSLGVSSSALAASITVSTGQANWLVQAPGSVGFAQAVTVNPNAAWVTPPIGSSWISFGSIQSISCTASGPGSTPGVDCSSGMFAPSGLDIATYSLTISSAMLGHASAGTLNLTFAGDNRFALTVGNNSQQWNWSGSPPTTTDGQGYATLGCPTAPSPSVAAASSGLCAPISFSALNLNPDGSLTLTVLDYNDPLPAVGSPGFAPRTLGNPSGILLAGTINTVDVPEPATAVPAAAALLAGFAWRKRKRAF